MPSLSESFTDLYGHAPDGVWSAPGRVNLIGEHTDYNDGLMLPATLPQRTQVEIARRPDRQVRAWSTSITRGAPPPATYVLGEEVRQKRWLDYVQGATKALADTGHAIGGFDLRIDSRVPRGGGLSSSAALLVALLRGLRQLYGLALDDVTLAHVARRAENDLVGAPVGIMDPLVISVGRAGEALFIDAASSTTRHVHLPPALALVVIDSGVHHSHAGGEYRVRKAECEAAARSLGVATLREAETIADLDQRIAALPEPLNRRARHVVAENARVRRAEALLTAGDLPALGRVLNAGHASLRDDYAVSVPAVDCLVAIAQAQPGVHGARLTGGGFGGAIVALADADRAGAAAAAIATAYQAATAHQPAVLVPAGIGSPETVSG